MTLQSKSADNYFEPFLVSTIELAKPVTDWVRYVELLKVAERAGDDNARYALASMYLHGPGIVRVRWRRDVARGLRLLRLASRSVQMAMLELASAYECGDFGLKVNNRKAYTLFARSVEFGSVTGRYHLGRCCYFGVGTKRDRRRAARLFREAAALGFPVYGLREA